MTEDLGDGEARFGVEVEHFADEIADISGNIVFELVLAFRDELLQVGHIAGFEGHRAVDHGK